MSALFSGRVKLTGDLAAAQRLQGLI
jgi:hypothetical protein